MNTSITKLSLLAIILTVLSTFSLKAQTNQTVTGTLTVDQGIFGESSIIVGSTTNNTSSYGLDSIQVGAGNSATGSYSICLGTGNVSSGYGSVSLGYYTTATGQAAAAFNDYSHANGASAAAFGNDTFARAAADFVIGQYNVGAVNNTYSGSTTWFAGNSTTAADPVFEIGDGTSSSAVQNALTVYKDGTMAVQNTVTAPTFVTTTNPNGTTDIPMFGH